VRVPISAGSFEPQHYDAGVCDNGPHIASSDGLFTVAVWAGQHPAALPPGIEVSFMSNYAFNVYGRRREVEAGTTK
jgi:hypothetical protein